MNTQKQTFVTLVGSLRKDSVNAAIARALPDLAPEHVEVKALGSIGDFPLYNQDVQEHEGFPQAVTDMANAIQKSDGLIIVTPEYNYSVPGVLKNALDWLSRVDPQPLAKKPVVIQTASPGAVGGARAQYHLRQILVFFDAYVLNKPEAMVGQAFSKIENGTITDDGTKEFLAGQLKAFSEFAAKANK